MIPLRPPTTAEDFKQIRAWAEDSRYAEFFRRFPPTFTWTEQYLASVPGFYLIGEGTERGICQLVNIDLVSGKAEVGVLIDEDAKNRRALAEAAVVNLFDYAMDHLRLEKLYCLILASRREGLGKWLTNLGFKEEGVLRSNCYWEGEHHDEIMYSALESDYRAYSARKTIKEAK